MNDDRSAIVRDLVTPLASGKGWLTFLGIITIVVSALGIIGSFGIGLVVYWLPIWMGVLLLQAAGALTRASMSGDEDSMRIALGKIRLYFVIQGVTIIVGIALAVLFFIFGGMAILAGMHHHAF